MDIVIASQFYCSFTLARFLSYSYD